MKVIYAHFAGALGLTFALAACIPPSPEPSPAPERTPAAQDPVPEISLPAAGPDPAYANWMDAPRTPGDWSYSREEVGQTRALYTAAIFKDPQGGVLARMTCSPGGNVILQRYADPRNIYRRTMTIRTETTTRSLQAPVDPEGRNMFAAVVTARDPLLDAMALTKGRFALELSDAPALYLPAWAEVTRVIEDCR